MAKTSVKWKTKKNKIPDMIKSLEVINGKKIEVGVFDGEHAWLAAIHEYGCDIRPKNAKYLAVPIHPKAKKVSNKISENGGSIRDNFKDLICIKNKKGNLFLIRKVKKGKNKGAIEFLYWLTDHIKIPERSFLRSGFDVNIDNINKQVEKSLKSFLNGNLSEDKFLEVIGKSMATKIKTYARDLNSPANASVTSEAKGTKDPLMDTGQMIESITWRVKD